MLILPDGSIILGGANSPISGDKRTAAIGGDGDVWIVKIKPDQPMALEQLTLTAQKGFDYSLLQWESTAPQALRYDIERSSAGDQAFVTLGSVENKKTFMDHNPMKGYNYYRIKETDLAGNTQYSNIASVRHYVAPKAGITIHTGDETVTISYRFAGQTPAEIAVYDLTGRMIVQQALTQTEGQISLPLSDLPAGVYSCRVSAGAVFYGQEKFVIGR